MRDDGEHPIEIHEFTIVNTTDEPVTWWQEWIVDPDGKYHVFVTDTRATVVSIARMDLARWADDGGRHV